MSEPTAGPYSVDEGDEFIDHGSGEDITSSHVKTYHIVDPNGVVLADTANSGATMIEIEYDIDGMYSAWDQQGKVNARLFAASWDLLAACEMQALIDADGDALANLDTLYALIKTHGWDGHEHPFGFVDRFRDAAIKKAKA